MRTTIDVDRQLAEVRRAQLRRRLATRVRSGTLPVATIAELRNMRAPAVPVGALSSHSRGRSSAS